MLLAATERALGPSVRSAPSFRFNRVSGDSSGSRHSEIEARGGEKAANEARRTKTTRRDPL